MKNAVNLRDALREHPLTTFDMPELSTIAHHFTMNTPFENRIVVNSPVLPTMLGVFFCRFGDGIFRCLNGNCRYVCDDDDRHFILCDIGFLLNPENALSDADDLTGISENISIYKDAEFEPKAQYYESLFRSFFRQNVTHFFPRWVIGHEVGDVALGHGKQPVRCNISNTVEIMRESKDREIAADLFFIERMIVDEETRMHCFSALAHTLNHWIRIETGTSL